MNPTEVDDEPVVDEDPDIIVTGQAENLTQMVAGEDGTTIVWDRE